MPPLISIDFQVSRTPLPGFTGRINDTNAVVKVELNSQIIRGVINSDSTWEILPGKFEPLDSGFYDVKAFGIGPLGNFGIDSTFNELLVILE